MLIAPNAFIVEHATVPEVEGPPESRKGRNGGAAPGVIATAQVRINDDLPRCNRDLQCKTLAERQDNAVAAECKRANEGLKRLGKEGEVVLVTGSGGGVVEQPMCAVTLTHIQGALRHITDTIGRVDEPTGSPSEPALMPQQQLKQSILQRMWRQVKNLEACIAAAVAQGEQHRNATTWTPLAQQLKLTEPATVDVPLIETNRCAAAEHLHMHTAVTGTRAESFILEQRTLLASARQDWRTTAPNCAQGPTCGRPFDRTVHGIRSHSRCPGARSVRLGLSAGSDSRTSCRYFAS